MLRQLTSLALAALLLAAPVVLTAPAGASGGRGAASRGSQRSARAGRTHAHRRHAHSHRLYGRRHYRPGYRPGAAASVYRVFTRSDPSADWAFYASYPSLDEAQAASADLETQGLETTVR